MEHKKLNFNTDHAIETVILSNRYKNDDRYGNEINFIFLSVLPVIDIKILTDMNNKKKFKF